MLLYVMAKKARCQGLFLKEQFLYLYSSLLYIYVIYITLAPSISPLKHFFNFILHKLQYCPADGFLLLKSHMNKYVYMWIYI